MTHGGSQRRWTGLLVAVLLAGGCVTEQQEGVGGTAALPTLDAIRRPRSVEVIESGRRPALRAHVLRVELPLDAPIEAAWEDVDVDAIDPTIRDAWLRNGIHIGVLNADAIDAFIQHVPPALATRNSLVLTDRPDPIALYRSPPLEKRIWVDLTIPPLSPTRTVLRNGHAQLLGRIVREEPLATALEAEADDSSSADRANEEFDLELQLHHHLEKPTLQPRLPQEKLLDGRIFHELTINLRLRPDQRIVVGLHRVPAAEETPPEEAAEQQPDTDRITDADAVDKTPAAPAEEEAADAADDVDQSETDDSRETMPSKPRYEPLPSHFGRQLLTGRRLGRNVQVLLIITFDP